MRLCLFIGHHKVGSTALQSFLWRNAARLLRAGILYPTVESEGHALMLRQALGGGGEAPFNAREAHNALAFRMLHERLAQPVPPWHPNLPSVHQMFVSIRNQLRFHQPRAVILCAEAFANFGPQAPELIAELAGLFPAAEISLHAIFRRPDQYLVAWHGQRLRFGHRVPPLGGAGLRLYEGTIHLDYQALLAPWHAALPGARLSLRNYDDVVAAGGTVRDFLAEAALAPLPPLLPEQRMNGSIHPALMEFARRANHVLPAPENVRFFEFLTEISPRIAVPDRREVELLGANRARLVEVVMPGLAWLDALTRGRFFPDAAAMQIHLPVPEVEANARVLPLLAAELRAAGRSEGLLPRLLEEA